MKACSTEIRTGQPDRGLNYWRDRILLAILSVGLTIGLFGFIPMTIMALEEGLWILIILNAAVWISGLTMLVFRRIRYDIRAFVTLMLTFAIGVYVIGFFGLFSGGPVCFFSFAVLAGLLLGLRPAVAALVINGVTLLIFGWLAATGRWGQDLPFFPSLMRGVVAWATYMVMNAIAAVSAAVLVRGMHELAEMERAASERVRNEHGKLHKEMDERIKTEEALRESERRYRLLAENVTDIIWTLSLDTFRFTYVSPSVFQMRGLRPEEVMEQSMEDILASESLESITKALAEELARDEEDGVDPKRSRTMELQQRNKDGSYTWVEATMTFIRDDRGRPAYVLGVTRDISERKRAEDEKKALEGKLQESQRMEAIATLAGGIAHQFNNALATIIGRLELLELELPGDQAKGNLGPMKETAHRMAKLTNQLLAYARGGKYQPKIISMSQFVRETLPLIEHTLRPSIHVETDLPRDTAMVMADVTQMQAVLSAIFSNASEAIEDAGRIRIACRNILITDETSGDYPGLRPGAYVTLVIEDDGKGMDEETKKKIFDPFFTTKFQGRGLGMAAVYGIVKNHGGWVTADSEPDRGSVVTLFFPATEKEAEIPTAEKAEAPPSIKDHGTILVIEDEIMVMDVCTALLKQMGYKVVGARTGKEAVDLAKTFVGDMDVAILDIFLPDMNGKTIYPLLMEARPNLKVLVCSGYSREGPAQEILDAGADGFIQKPFNIQDLSNKIKEVRSR